MAKWQLFSEIYITTPNAGDVVELTDKILAVSGTALAFIEDPLRTAPNAMTENESDVVIDSVNEPVVVIDSVNKPDVEIVSVEVEIDSNRYTATWQDKESGFYDWNCEIQIEEVGLVSITAILSLLVDKKLSVQCKSPKRTIFVAAKVEFASWFRIEPRCRSNDFARGLEARTADPLWMLARQWQVGEFQGEDAGSPLAVNLEYSTQSLDRVRLGQSNIPIANAPLEAIAEREYLPLDWRSRVQVGQQLERFARTQLPGTAAEEFIKAYRNDYPLQPTADEWEEMDRATRQFLQVVGGRVVDGGKLLGAIGGIAPDQYNEAIAELKKWCENLGIQLDPSRPSA